MQLNLHQNQHQNAINSCDQHGITVQDVCYQASLIVGTNSLHTNWPVHSLDQVSLENLQPVLDAAPGILLIGTGTHQELPVLPLMQALLQRNIVPEFMHTAAACRTFNVLLSEDRDVMAALIWNP